MCCLNIPIAEAEAERLCRASEASHIYLGVVLGYRVKSDLNFNPLHFADLDATICDSVFILILAIFSTNLWLNILGTRHSPILS
jgi:hypothetical protein